MSLADLLGRKTIITGASSNFQGSIGEAICADHIKAASGNTVLLLVEHSALEQEGERTARDLIERYELPKSSIRVEAAPQTEAAIKLANAYLDRGSDLVFFDLSRRMAPFGQTDNAQNCRRLNAPLLICAHYGQIPRPKLTGFDSFDHVYRCEALPNLHVKLERVTPFLEEPFDLQGEEFTAFIQWKLKSKEISLAD